MLVVFIPIIIICFICSYQFRQGKWLMLIAGYNEFSKEKREQMDSQKIGRDASKITMLTGGFLILFLVIFFVVNTYEFSLKTEDELLLILLPTAIFIWYVMKQVSKYLKYYDKFR